MIEKLLIGLYIVQIIELKYRENFVLIITSKLNFNSYSDYVTINGLQHLQIVLKSVKYLI